MTRKRFRVRAMGCIDTWWCVQERRWYGWATIAPHLTRKDEAVKIMKHLLEIEEGDE